MKKHKYMADHKPEHQLLHQTDKISALGKCTSMQKQLPIPQGRGPDNNA